MERNLLLVNMQANTSLRVSDVLKMKVGDVYRKGKFINCFWIEQKKTKEIVLIYLVDCIIKELYNVKALYERLFSKDYFENPENPLFPSKQFDLNGEFKPIGYTTYFSLLQGWIMDIGLNSDLYGTHSLRVGIPLKYYQITTDPLGMKELFGHLNLETTMGYVENEAKVKAAMYRKKYHFDD